MKPADDSPRSSLVLYQTEDGRTRVQCRFEGDTLWLTQAQMADLFQVTVPTVNYHLKGIYDDGELDVGATIRDYLIVRLEGTRQVSRDVEHYSLPAILAVGYRVRSPRGTLFRQWATAHLAEFLVKGFTLDDERLKSPPGPGVPDYFDELLERIRDIRASERRMYTRIRDLLALAADYAPDSASTQVVFQVVQNKLHHAVTGMTAPELIAARADATQPNMGLDEFLRFNERSVLSDAGHVTREHADDRATAEYEQFAERRRAQVETEGEADALRALEDVARKLPQRRAVTPKKGARK